MPLCLLIQSLPNAWQVTALVKGMLVLNPALKAPYAEPNASCETRKTSKRWTAIGIVYKVCIRQWAYGHVLVTHVRVADLQPRMG